MRYQDFIKFTKDLQNHVKTLASDPNKYPAEETLKLQAKYMKLFGDMFYDQLNLYADEAYISIAKGQLTAMGLSKYDANMIVGSEQLDWKNIETFYKNIDKIDFNRLSIGFDSEHLQEYVDNLEKKGWFKDELDENGNFKKPEDLDIKLVDAKDLKDIFPNKRNPFFDDLNNVGQELAKNTLKEKFFAKNTAINTEQASEINTDRLLSEVDTLKDKILYKDVLKQNKIQNMDSTRFTPYMNLIKDLQKIHNARPWYQRFFGYFGKVGQENNKINELKNELVKLGGGSLKDINKALNAKTNQEYDNKVANMGRALYTQLRKQYPDLPNDHISDVPKDLIKLINNNDFDKKLGNQDVEKEKVINTQKDLTENLKEITNEKAEIVNNKVEEPVKNAPTKAIE